MNRIYKVIWSKVKHQYVVVSELAHRDGKRSSAATKSSWRAMAAALMLTGVLTAVPHVGYAVDGGVATEGNYIAVAVVTTTDLPGKFSGEWYNPNSNKFGNDYYWNGRRWTKCDDSRTFTVGNQSYTYNKVTVEGKTYWVRDGYTIEISHEKLYPGATSDVVIDAFKESGADDGDLLKSYQTLSTQGNITTATGYNIHDTNTGVYGGADNQGGTKTPSDFGYNLDLDHSGNYSTRVSSNGDNKDYPDQVNNFSDYFKPVEEVNGTYRYNGQVVGTSNLYVIDGQLGVFVDEQGEIYTGSVLGDSNEILMTAIDGSGDYISYWATKVTDPNATMGSYRISDYNADRLELKNDIKGAHGDDIKQINLVQNTDGNGGMIAFQRYGKYDENSDTYTGDYNVPGTITIQNTELSGTNGNDVKIQFGSINEKGENIPQFTVDAGSQVEANKADATATSGQLSTLTINGNTYGLPTGTTYSDGNGIAISDSHEISVDTVAEKDGGNLYFTDGKLNSRDYRLINGTEVIGGTEEAPVYGYKVNDDGTVELNVQDGTDETSKQTVTIADVASKSALDDVSKTLGGAVMYDKSGNTYNYGSVTLGKADNKYSYDSETHTATGGVTLTNVAYADVDGENSGSNAVNVDLLKDYVDENAAVYSDGSGIAISTDGKNTISVDIVENGNLFFNEKGELNSKDYRLVNGTTDLGEGKKGYKVKEDGTVELTVQDSADKDSKQTVTIADVASKSALDDVSKTLGGAVMYDKTGETYNYSSVTLGNGENKYSYNNGNPTGGVTLTNVAYADVDGKNTGSNAVNVDLLKDYVGDYVDENGGGAWNLTTNGEVNTAVSVSKGDTVDFSGALSSTLNGEEHSNIVVNKTTTDGNTSVTFDLADELTLGLGDTLNSIYINGNTGLMTLTNAENGNNWITLDAKSRSITGLASDLDNENWNAFMDGASNVDFTRAATTSDLRQVAMHSVQYEVNDDGAIDYGNIVLGNGQADLYVYDGLNSRGGTRLSNVAYAVTDRTNEAYDGSAAVNVDLLNDTVADVTTTVKANEKHIATNVGEKPDVEGGQYSVKDGKITLAEVDGSGAMTGNAVVIDNVASASDLGDVTQIHDGLMNKDENGNSIDTSVVDAVNNLDDKVGDLKYNDVKGDSIQNDDDTTTAIGKLDNRIDGLETDISGAAEEAKKHNTVEAGSNIVVTTSQNANGGTEYKVSVDPNLKVDTVTASGNIDAGSFSTGDITINKDNSGVIDGLKNKEWTPDTVDYSDSGRAATEAQLSSAMSNTVQYDSSDKTSVTFNKGGDAVTIHNVAAGEVSATSTDAVNGSQLYLRDMAIVNNSNNIQMLSNSVNELDTRIDRVGAGAAALAALHPLDFDPDAKWDFAAGYGNYRGANAVAVGAYYRPNEDVMFSVGGSMGGGENMVNAGVSFKLGAGSSHVTTSRVAMAKEIKSMRDIVAKQDAQIQKLTAMVNALVGVQTEPDTTTMFPDVPENHWAYEAVAAMAKSGLVKGYPDGEFKGDRTMTRYEFAQIVYNAIQAGAEVDSRLVAEFQPELEYFHIATVAKDKDGNPTIERVRAN